MLMIWFLFSINNSKYCLNILTIDDWDPPWMSSFMKNLVRAKYNFHKKFVRQSNNMYYLCAFKNLQDHLSQYIQIAKQSYVNKIAQRLGDTNNSSNWSLMKTLLNLKKMTCIPPLFHGDKYVVDFQKNKVRFLVLFSLTNILQFQTEASCLLNYHCEQIAHYLLVTLKKRTSFELSTT